MKFLIVLVVCCLCINEIMADGDTYRAGVIQGLNSYGDLERILPLINSAGQEKVDILVLPSPRVFTSASNVEESCGLDSYDELVKALSGASKQAGVYLVAHLLEKARCQNRNELIRSNLVFDREGDIVSVYRKPLNNVANCTTAPKDIGTFRTGFGVTFGVLMEEDLILREENDLKGLKNFVVNGDWSSEIPFLSASQFASSWSFVNRANVISPAGIFSSTSQLKNVNPYLKIGDLKKSDNAGDIAVPLVASTVVDSPKEDLSLYAVRPLDLEASRQGYKETVCQGDFCCDFFIKTQLDGSRNEGISYSLATFNGARSFSRTHNIGAQICALFTCEGSYKTSCSFGLNASPVAFDRISVSANFSGDIQYPMVFAGADMGPVLFKTSTSNGLKQVSVETERVKNMSTLAIFGRDTTKDSVSADPLGAPFDFYSYVFNDDVQQFFDYVWIRLRVLIFIVSIYVLEML